MRKREIDLDRKRIAKRLLAEKGVKVYIKDVFAIGVSFGYYPAPDGSRVGSKETWYVEMNNGTRYEINRETQDASGNFSTASGRMVTTDIIEY